MCTLNLSPDHFLPKAGLEPGFLVFSGLCCGNNTDSQHFVNPNSTQPYKPPILNANYPPKWVNFACLFTAELETQDGTADLSHAEWLGLLIDRETASRETKRFESRMRSARLRHVGASPEDVDYRAQRGLDKALFQELLTGKWIADKRNLILTGPCGVGKTWLACALAQAACRTGVTVLYRRLPRLFDELELAHGDGRFPRLFRSLTKTQLLILDDWGPDRLTASQRRDLMEIVEDRYGAGSTLITSQLPLSTWHDVIGEPTFADAILDRIVHNAYRLELSGQSLRKTMAKTGDENCQR